MTTGRKLLFVAGGFTLLLVVLAIGVPNLLRSRIASKEVSEVAAYLKSDVPTSQQGALRAASLQAVNDRKEIRNAELGLIVADVRGAADRIRSVTKSHHGAIDNVEVTERGVGSLSGRLVVRVPSSELDAALGEFKKIALRADREQITARDVTREFYDNEAHLRNLRAEEEQYLTIMKQARTVKDTLDVSEKLSDVRDRIERLQAQIQLMTHDIDMSVVTIVLVQDYESDIPGVHWQPLYNAKIAGHELLIGLGEWIDWIIAVIIKLPLILLWIVTGGAILWVIWVVGRSMWFRLIRPALYRSNGAAKGTLPTPQK